MIYSHEVEKMCTVAQGVAHGEMCIRDSNNTVPDSPLRVSPSASSSLDPVPRDHPGGSLLLRES